MCSHLYGTMGIFRTLSENATEEIIGLFQEWMDAVEDECNRILENNPGCSVQDLASQIGISEEGAKLILKKIKRKEEVV